MISFVLCFISRMQFSGEPCIQMYFRLYEYHAFQAEVGRESKSCTQVKALLLYNNNDASRSKSTHQICHKTTTQVVSNLI